MAAPIGAFFGVGTVGKRPGAGGIRKRVMTCGNMINVAERRIFPPARLRALRANTHPA